MQTTEPTTTDNVGLRVEILREAGFRKPEKMFGLDESDALRSACDRAFYKAELAGITDRLDLTTTGLDTPAKRNAIREELQFTAPKDGAFTQRELEKLLLALRHAA